MVGIIWQYLASCLTTSCYSYKFLAVYLLTHAISRGDLAPKNVLLSVFLCVGYMRHVGGVFTIGGVQSVGPIIVPGVT